MPDDADEKGLEIRIETTPRDAYEFVKKLAKASFREEVRNDPERVLREHGIEIPNYQPEGGVNLPPVSELRELARWMERSKDLPVLTVLVPLSQAYGVRCVVGDTPEEDESDSG